jgi:hypothetical protein
MTDYNDGKWHGWNGGECPVHPSTVIEAIWDDGSRAHICADEITWEAGNTEPCAFRVISPHREAREFWVNMYEDGFCNAYLSADEANRYASISRVELIHVREVMDDN